MESYKNRHTDSEEDTDIKKNKTTVDSDSEDAVGNSVKNTKSNKLTSVLSDSESQKSENKRKRVTQALTDSEGEDEDTINTVGYASTIHFYSALIIYDY